jgi:type II secretory pathway component PulF
MPDWRAALALAGPATASPWMAAASAQMGRDLGLGHALATAMAAGNRRGRVRLGRDLFSPTLVQWVHAGEAAGTLPSMLSQWSQLQSEAMTQQWQLATRLLEPLLMGVLGLGMGWLVLALYLPVMQMGQWL